MYLETMEDILQNTKTVILGNKDSNVLPYLPFNELKKGIQIMNEGKILSLAITLAIVVFILFSTSVFTVQENQQVLVMRFGNPKDQIAEPGLHFKLAFLDQTRVF